MLKRVTPKGSLIVKKKKEPKAHQSKSSNATYMFGGQSLPGIRAVCSASLKTRRMK